MNFRQNGDKYLITIEVIALIVVLVFGAVHFVMPGDVYKRQEIDISKLDVDSQYQSIAVTVDVLSTKEVPIKCTTTGLSLIHI